MTTARINIVGYDSQDRKWFWYPWGNCWVESPHEGCNYSTKLAAAENIGMTAVWQRNQDPEDRMIRIDIEEVK